MKEYKTALPELTLKYNSGDQRKTKITSSADANIVLKNLYDADTLEYIETCIALFLNRANNTIGWLKVSQGGITGTIIDQRIIFATALKCGASGIIISHNHPSGQLTPSRQDLQLTAKIVEAGKLLQIPILDHLIITAEGYISLADEGHISQ